MELSVGKINTGGVRLRYLGSYTGNTNNMFYGAQLFYESRARRSSTSLLSRVSSACAKRNASLVEEAEVGMALSSEDARSMEPEAAAMVESPNLAAVPSSAEVDCGSTLPWKSGLLLVVLPSGTRCPPPSWP